MKNEVMVKNILSLPSLDGAQIIAGKSYAGNIISTVAVMEVPDVSAWVQEGELLITTGYMFKDNIDDFVSIIPELTQRKVAALAIKPNRFLDKIPEKMIKAASKERLPLIYLPPHANFSKITSEIMEQILVKNINSEYYLIHNIISKTPLSLTEINEYAKDYNISLTHDTYFRLLTTPMMENYMYSSLKETLKSLFHDTNICVLTTNRDKLIGILCIYDKEDVWNSFIKNNLTYLEQIINNYNTNLFIGECQKGFNNNSSLLEDITSLMDIFESSSQKTTVVTWDNIGLLSIIPSITNTPFHRYLKHTYINPLKDYDLTQKASLFTTLQEYIRCNGNMKLAAQNLYIHYNTMCYRINKIKEDFGWDLEDVSILTNLNLAFLLEQHIGS